MQKHFVLDYNSNFIVSPLRSKLNTCHFYLNFSFNHILPPINNKYRLTTTIIPYQLTRFHPSIEDSDRKLPVETGAHGSIPYLCKKKDRTRRNQSGADQRETEDGEGVMRRWLV